MKKLFAERFKSARLMNGYSLQDLSEALGTNITKQALHKYEKGEVLSNSEMIDLLSEALNVRPDYFTRKTIIELDEIRFRKLEKFPVKEQHMITEQTREDLSRYLELEEILGLNKKFKHPIPSKMNKITSFEDIETIAEKIRTEWNLGLDPISNVLELLEEHHIKVIKVRTNDGFDGMSTWVNNKDIPVIVLNEEKLEKKDRIRFTALHELAHLLLSLEEFDSKTQERYCNRFAGAMLFPKQAMIKVFNKNRSRISIQELGLLKQQFGMSIQALVYRLGDLEIITKNYRSYYFRYIKEKGWRIDEPFDYSGSEESTRFIHLIHKSLAEEIISISKAATLCNMKLDQFRTKYLMLG